MCSLCENTFKLYTNLCTFLSICCTLKADLKVNSKDKCCQNLGKMGPLLTRLYLCFYKPVFLWVCWKLNKEIFSFLLASFLHVCVIPDK